MRNLLGYVTVAAVMAVLLGGAGCSSGSPSNPGDQDSDHAENETEAPLCDAADWGAYGVGATAITLTDASRQDRELPVLVVYPTATRPDYRVCEAAFLEESILWRYSEATMCAQQDAPAATDGAPFPVVFLSHGSGSMKEGYTYLEEYLASHGFVVVAPDHTGNVGLSQFAPADTSMSYTRLADMRFVMDEMTAAFDNPQSPFHGLGDEARMGMAGHSWGGHAAVVMAGMAYNYEKIAAECAAGTQVDQYQCPLLAHRDEIESMTPDTRLRAVVSWAHDIGKASQPGGPVCFGASGVHIPWMMMLGDEDPYLVWQEDGQDCYDKAGGTACLVTLSGAGHMGYTDMGNEKTMEDERMYLLVRRYSTAFFMRHLMDIGSCQEAMDRQALDDGADHTRECK